MITIESTDKERYEELVNKSLVVHTWNKSSEISMMSPDETISHALRRYAGECNLFGMEVEMNGIPEKIRITKKTVDESISAMRRQRADLLDLGKMFTVLKPVLQSAVLIDAEPFRYQNMHKAKMISGEYHYISAFHDFRVLYPVKITVERYKRSDYTNIHVIITVGKIRINDISDKIKRSLSYTGVHPSQADGESLFSEDASFVINILHIVELFNTSEGVIIKNLPDMILSEEQKRIKKTILLKDAEKIKKKAEKYRSR